MDSGYTEDRMWKRELPGGRERGHTGTDVTEEDVGIGWWRQVIRCEVCKAVLLVCNLASLRLFLSFSEERFNKHLAFYPITAWTGSAPSTLNKISRRRWINGWFGEAEHEAASYHVWLLGSQVSFPTLSMQNFWGPLLPAGHTHTNKTQNLNRKLNAADSHSRNLNWRWLRKWVILLYLMKMLWDFQLPEQHGKAFVFSTLVWS